MSDFITGLRADLVAAAEREQRRRPLARRAASLHPRTWTLAGAAAATAVAAVIAVVAVAVNALRPERNLTAHPRVVAVVAIGGQPQDAVAAAGSLWITDFEGRVVRVDPATRRVLARVPVEGTPIQIAAGAGGVWVLSLDSVGQGSHLRRIDPATNRVVKRLPVDTYAARVLVAAGDRLWIADEHSRHLLRVDPVGGGVERVRAPFPDALAAAGERLWLLAQRGTVLELDATSGRTVHELPGLAPTNDPEPDRDNSLLPDGRGAWLANTARDDVLLVQDGQVVRSIGVGGKATALARAGSALWVAAHDPSPTRADRLVRIDVETGRVVAGLDLHGRVAKALVPVGRDLWVVTADGAALLVRG